MRFGPFFVLYLASIVTAADATASTLRKRRIYQDNARRIQKFQNRRRVIQQSLLSKFQKLPGSNPSPSLSQKRFQQANDPSRDLQDNQDQRTVIVECSETSLFRCPTCGDKIQAQQDQIWHAIHAMYPTAVLVSSSQRLVNAIYVQLPDMNDVGGSNDSADNAIRKIDGVVQVTPHGNLEMDTNSAVDYIGGFRAQLQSCATGRGIKVAVLDSGIDYTHYILGGPGTLDAYRAAYGDSPLSFANRQRDDLFPTDVVIDGYDFVGEFTSPFPDDDPIDAFGHGTAVADAILSVAPNAKLLAVKVCSPSMACPVSSLISGLEFALDPNGDGLTDDSVDVINISMGIPWLSPFYNFVVLALEAVANEYGVVTVVSAGNSGNIPYVFGGLSGSPSCISVGATGHPDTIDRGVMAMYSSRGPGENSMLKPDIAAPSGLTLAAAGTGTYRYRSIEGTSFSAPLVTGAAAVVKERCPECTPFAIKALLMNNANRGTRYYNNSETLSPITLSGSGELQVDKAIAADVWAYSVQDVQPSISLGLINAAFDVSFTRTIKVINLSNSPKFLSVSYAMRNPNHPYLSALQIAFNTTVLELAGSCNSEAYLEVTFSVDASSAPSNHMTSGGLASFNPATLDMHELGGHIVLLALEDAKDISLPFVAIIRQASNVTIDVPVIPNFDKGPVEARVGLSNDGAGTAQIDAFQLLSVSLDDPEMTESEERMPPNDFRYIGYRVLDVRRPGCTHLVEFAFNNWEEKGGRLVTEIYGIDIDINGDKEGDKFLFNTALAHECLVVDDLTNTATCVGMPPDHGTSSHNTILRACSEELGISDFEGKLGVHFKAVTFFVDGAIVPTDTSAADETDFIMVDFPRPALSAPSYDIFPGQSLETIQLDGRTNGTFEEAPLGLMLVTNAYRTSTSTGAATPSTEVFVLLRDGLNREGLPLESTPDILAFTPPENLGGPGCSWQVVDATCDGVVLGNTDIDDANTLESPIAEEDSVLDPIIPMPGFDLTQSDNDEDQFVDECPALEVPRAPVLTVAPTPGPLSSIDIPVVISAQGTKTNSAKDANTNAVTSGKDGTNMGITSSYEAVRSQAGAQNSVSLSVFGFVTILCLNGLFQW